MTTFRWSVADVGALAVASAYALLLRGGLEADSQALGVQPTTLDQIYWTFLDPRVPIYLFLPLLLFRAIQYGEQSGGELVLIRCSTYWRWLGKAVLNCVADSVKLVAILLVSGLLSAIGLDPGPPVATWPLLGVAPADQGALVLLTGIAVISKAAFLSSYGALVAVLSILVGRYPAIGAGIVVFADVVITSNAPSQLAFLNLIDGLSPIAAVQDWGPTPLAVLMPTLVLSSIWLGAISIADQRAKGNRLALILASPRAMLVYACAIVTAAIAAGSTDSTMRSFYGTFVGSSEHGTYLPDYVLHALLFLGPIALLLTRLDDHLDAALYPELIRHRSISLWSTGTILTETGKYAAYTGVVGVYALLLGLLNTGGLGSLAEIGIAQGDLLWQFFVNGSLQGGFYVVSVFMARWVVGRLIGGVLALGLLVAGGFLFSPFGFPAAQNSLGLLLQGGDPLTISLQLALWILAALMAMLLLNRSLGARLLERNLAE